MAVELAGEPFGSRLQTLRTRRGMSRAVLGALLGRSEDWVKKLEAGKIGQPGVETLVLIARVLGLPDLSALIGSQGVVISPTGKAGHEAVPPLRAAIEDPMLVLPTSPPVSAESLTVRAADAWATWHTSPSPRAAVGAVLPRLIRDGRHAARVLEGAERRTAHAALSSAYGLSEQLLAWVADGELLRLAADRCLQHAEQADNPGALALAAWVVGNVWRVTPSREEDALRMATDAADLLTPLLDEHEHARGLWGSLRLHAAITAGKMGREGDAGRWLDDADEMARRMDAYTHPATLFGRPNAILTGVSVAVDLRKGGRAVNVAETVDPTTIPSRDRQARLWLEMARAYRLRKDNSAALHVLRRATEVSREGMACHPLSRTLASELVITGGPLVSREARTLAQDLGVAV